jgi:hypothetical protein
VAVLCRITFLRPNSQHVILSLNSHVYLTFWWASFLQDFLLEFCTHPFNCPVCAVKPLASILISSHFWIEDEEKNFWVSHKATVSPLLCPWRTYLKNILSINCRLFYLLLFVFIYFIYYLFIIFVTEEKSALFEVVMHTLHRSKPGLALNP